MLYYKQLYYLHPEVYIIILPGFGLVSHIINNYTHKPIFGALGMIFAMLSIGLLGFLVWAQNGQTIIGIIVQIIWLNAGIVLLFKLLWIYYNSIVIIFKFNQSAGNSLESSETLCQKTYLHQSKYNNNFIKWFIGFTEGNNSFIITSSQLFFILYNTDYKVLEYIKKNLGFGKIHKYKNTYRYIVNNKDNIDILINIFNGKLYLNKTNSIFELWLNIRNQSHLYPIPFLSSLLSSDLTNNAWLSGYIDAKGIFNAKLEDQIKVKFSIISESHIINYINNSLLHTNTLIPQSSISLYTLDSLFLLNQYLKKYPLKSKKSISLIRFNKLINYIEDESLKPWSKKVNLRIENLIKNLNKDNM